MTLQERVDSDLKEAMRAKDTRKLGVLRMLKSALKYAAIAKSGAEAELRGIVDLGCIFTAGDEFRRTGQGCARDNCGDWRHVEGADGRCHESITSQSGGSRRWQDFEPGSAKAVE